MEITASGGSTGVLILVLGFVILIVVLVWMTSTRGRVRPAREETLFQLGYGLADPPPPQLVEQITAMRRHTTAGAIELRRVYYRPISGARLYLFDLHLGGTSSDPGTQLAVHSPTLDLPRFALTPMPGVLKSGGMMASLLDRAMDAAAAHTGMTELDFADDPEFDETYVTFAEDEAAVRALLDSSMRAALLQSQRQYTLDGYANTLGIAKTIAAQATAWTEDELYAAQEDAERFLALFRRSRFV